MNVRSANDPFVTIRRSSRYVRTNSRPSINICNIKGSKAIASSLGPGFGNARLSHGEHLGEGIKVVGPGWLDRKDNSLKLALESIFQQELEDFGDHLWIIAMNTTTKRTQHSMATLVLVQNAEGTKAAIVQTVQQLSELQGVAFVQTNGARGRCRQILLQHALVVNSLWWLQGGGNFKGIGRRHGENGAKLGRVQDWAALGIDAVNGYTRSENGAGRGTAFGVGTVDLDVVI